MVWYTCDGCGKRLEQNALRYTVAIDVRAAYDQLEVGLMDLVRDHRADMLALIEKLQRQRPEDIEETVYKNLKLDLCPACQRAFIRNPLRFHPEQGAPDTEIDIDGFLRGLGFGSGETENPSE